MTRKTWLFSLLTLAVALAIVIPLWGSKIEFLLGGAMINAGYRLQDRLEDYDLEHHEITPMQVWDRFLAQNHLAASVRSRFPRSTRHPVVAMVACMDARLDTNEIAGDTRHYYYILRQAGSVLAEKEEEMLELAVSNGVKVVVFTTHTDCAAEKVAANPEQRKNFPKLSEAVDEREARFNEFLARPLIRERMASNSLMVKWMDLDTSTEAVMPHASHAQAQPAGSPTSH
jgi:hypothetical protein